MRLVIVNLVVAGLLLFGATSASAIALSVVATTPTSINIGDTVTIEVFLDTEGETQVTSVFISTSSDNPGALSFTSGTSPNLILIDFSTFAGLSKVSDPVDGVVGDAPGRVRAANFATADATGSGIASADQLLATLIFTATSGGTINIAPLVEQGTNPDEFTVSQLSVAGAVTIGAPVTITVPEPSSAILSIVALGTIGLIRRRSSTVAASGT